jgi:hypothetical protein
MLDRVEVVGARGIGARGNGDALKEWARPRKPREREIADHPAVSYLIIHYEWVTIILVLTRRAYQGGKECVVRDRARQHVPRLIKNRVRGVDRFHVMIWADIAVAVWWRASAELSCAPALKGQKRSWHLWRRPGKSLHQPL